MRLLDPKYLEELEKFAEQFFSESFWQDVEKETESYSLKGWFRRLFKNDEKENEELIRSIREGMLEDQRVENYIEAQKKGGLPEGMRILKEDEGITKSGPGGALPGERLMEADKKAKQAKRIDGSILKFLRGKWDIHQAAAAISFQMESKDALSMIAYRGLLEAAVRTKKLDPADRDMALRQLQHQKAGIQQDDRENSQVLMQANQDEQGETDTKKTRLKGYDRWENLGKKGDTAKQKAQVVSEVLKSYRSGKRSSNEATHKAQEKIVYKTTKVAPGGRE